MSKEKLTTEEFLKNNDYAKALSNYAARQGKEFGSREQALENFLSDYRGVQSNTGLAVLFANRVSNIEDDEERLELGRLYKAVDEDLEDFAGQQSGLATVGEYAYKGILDPLNLLGFGTGAIVGRTVGKLALNRIISNAFKGNIAKEVSKGTFKKTAGIGAGIGGVEGVGQGLSLEDVKGKDKLGIQDEMNLGNVALMGGLGAVTGGAFGALGGRKAAKELTRVGEVLQERTKAIENTTQGKLARRANVQNFLNKQKDNFDTSTIIGTYVRPVNKKQKLIDRPNDYGEFGLITGIVDGKAEVEFLPTTFAQKLNPKTNKFDERKTVGVEFNKIKGVSEVNKREYQKKFVENYGLFFSKADIEKGRDILKSDPSVSIQELDTIFEVGLKKEDFINVTNVVFDAASDVLENPNVNPQFAAKVRVIMEDPMKRISEKFGELISLGTKDQSFLDSSIANQLVNKNLTNPQFANALVADIAISMSKGAQMSNIQKLVSTNKRIGKKLERIQASLTDTQRKVFADIEKQREIERKMAQKFGLFVDVWRSFLVTQPATTFRNIFGSALRVPGETLDISLQSMNFMRQFEAKALGMDAPKDVDLPNESLLLAKNLLNPLEQIELAAIVGREFNEAQRKIFDVFDDYFAVTLGDDSKAGGFIRKLAFASKWANIGNRAQDRAIKSAGFMTELDNQVKGAIRRGEITDPEVKGAVDLIRQNKLNLVNDEMVSKSLEFAYKLTYQSRDAGDDLLLVGGIVNNTQRFLNQFTIAKFGIPFPNFLINAFVYTLNRGVGFGMLKSLVKGGQVLKQSTKKSVEAAKEERARITDLTKKIDARKKSGVRTDNQKYSLNQLETELKNLQAAAGKRLKNVEQFRKGIVESAEGIALLGVGYGIRETMGGPRYNEVKIQVPVAGENTFNFGPLFPLLPFLFLGEALRKILNDEPFDAKFIAEGAEALAGLQTDRMGPLAKTFSGIKYFLENFDSEDPLAAKRTGEAIGGGIGYVLKGLRNPALAFNDAIAQLGPKEFRQTFEKGFQEIITEEGETYSAELVRGILNEFVRQMVRGTTLQGAVFGERSTERPTQSVTGLQQDPKFAPLLKQFPPGAAPLMPRDNVGEELARVGIDAYKLADRSEVPEYTFEFKKRLGELAEKNLKPFIQTEEYKALPIEEQKLRLEAAYKGQDSGLSPEQKKAYRGLGYKFPSLRKAVREQIKVDLPYLYRLHNFRKNNRKADVRELYRQEAEAGRPIPQIKYYGEETTDRGINYAAEKQNEALDAYQAKINENRKRRAMLPIDIRGEAIGQREGGYIGQMRALGF
jgi:hypothetical protein